ncbi:hypothetical protein KKF91_16190 [Myxococcota bacterium]|nr:hypothetical protein [Myxococcota bacterium]MBU1432081.1 hypothetical protein [Myxococcota bacterium]MBU1897777.1 hypothetical protein [Myxococcota bacterium]
MWDSKRMDRHSEPLELQIERHGEAEAVEARILIDEMEETFMFQVWMDSHEHPLIRLDVGPIAQRARLWPLLKALLEFKRIKLLGYRPLGTYEWRPPPEA